MKKSLKLVQVTRNQRTRERMFVGIARRGVILRSIVG